MTVIGVTIIKGDPTFYINTPTTPTAVKRGLSFVGLTII